MSKHTTTRRAVLAGAAALPALAVPAFAVTELSNNPANDPIFAAIERHRQTEAAYVAACNATPKEAVADLKTIYAAEEKAGEIGDRSNSELAELVAMTPTTIAGCAALLLHVEAYVTEYDQGGLFHNYRDIEEPARTLLSRIAGTLAVQS